MKRFAASASVLLLLGACDFSRGQPPSAHARLQSAIAKGEPSAIFEACRDYFDSPSSRQAPPEVLSGAKDDCAAAFSRWFAGLPETLDQETLDRIETMAWLAVVADDGGNR